MIGFVVLILLQMRAWRAKNLEYEGWKGPLRDGRAGDAGKGARTIGRGGEVQKLGLF